MKIKSITFSIFLTVVMLPLLWNCQKEDPKTVPVVTTGIMSNFTIASATVDGAITNDGGVVVTDRGICWNTNPNPTIADNKTTDGAGSGSFTSSITGLLPGRTYYFRAYATNSLGTAYGNQITATTSAILPEVKTTVISAITNSTVKSSGDIISDGGAPVTVRGVCWSTDPNPTTANSKTIDGSGTGTFTVNLTGLLPGTTYYLKAYATNILGTTYGNEVSFKTNNINFNQDLTYGTMTDIDGNEYKTITIGAQTWMAENLKVTKYRNGDPIPNVTVGLTWVYLTYGAHCWYDHDVTNKATYGALYNWFAIADRRNIAPAGWHVPTNAEWTTLETFLGGASIAGDKIKESGSIHWTHFNKNATNSSGFTALPAGSYTRQFNGTFNGQNNVSAWWSTTAINEDDMVIRSVYAEMPELYYSGAGRWSGYGLSVRCIKD